MVVKVFLFLLCVLETLQHLSYPINFCNMASTCIHDSRVVCASSPDGCSRRSFLDQCDMYEYNCDYGTQYMTKVTSSCTSGYQETYILFCGTILTSTQFTQTPSSMTSDTTSTEISKSSTTQLTQTLPENITSKSNTEINPDTVPLTILTSTPVTPSVHTNTKENDANKSDDDTTVNPTTYVYCCDRPLTWETTTEVTKKYDIIINNNSNEHKQTTETSTEYIITDNIFDETTNIYNSENNIIFTTINQKISDTVTLDDTTIFVTTEADEAPEKNQSTMEIVNQTTPENGYNRPLTWETTTEVTKITEDKTINNNSAENKLTTETTKEYNVTDNVYDETTNIHDNENTITFTTINQKISDTVTLDDTTVFVTTETDEAPEKRQSTMEIVNQTRPEYGCNRPLTWETTTEVTKTIEDIPNEINNSEENKLTAIVTDTSDSYTQDTSKYSSTPATLPIEKLHPKSLYFTKVSNNCHDKCQRPLTWLTTRRRRKHYRN